MKTAIFVLLFIFSCTTTFAQKLTQFENNFRFETVLPDPTIKYGYGKIVQDKQGYLWIDNYGIGLYKFNGYNSVKYQNDPFDPTTLYHNNIYNMWLDKNDTLWLGTPEGLCKFDTKTEKFTRYNTTLIPDMPDLRNVSPVREDNEGNLWIGNLEGKIWRFNRKTGKFLSLTSKLNVKNFSKLAADYHDGIYSIFKDKSGIIWIGTGLGLHRANLNDDPDKISFSHFLLNPLDNNTYNYRVYNIFQDHAGVLWVCSLEDIGLNSFDTKTEKFTRYLKSSQPFSISSNRVRNIVEDTSGNLWIATDNGLNKLNKERIQFTTWFANECKDFELKSNNIYNIFLDASGNLFISSDILQTINIYQKKFGLFQPHPKTKNSTGTNQISTLTEDRFGNIWIGTPEGLIEQQKKSGQAVYFTPDEKKFGTLKRSYISGLIPESNGDMWIGNDEYLSLLKYGSNVFESFNSDIRNFKNSDSNGGRARTILSMCKDESGLIWLGMGNGIKRFNPTTKIFTHYFYEAGNPTGISDYVALSIINDSRGNIWVGTGSIAFNKFDKKTGKFTHYKNNPLDTNSISANIVYSIFEDSKHRLWIGTQGGGLCEYNYKTDNFTTHTRNKGLAWTAVFSIQEDNNGDLWLGTNRGISRYNVSNKTFTDYDEKDGLQSNYYGGGFYGIGSSCKGSDGTLYFGCYSGFNYFNPNEIYPNSFIPPIVITQFKIFDKIQPGKNEAKEIVLKHDQNFFSFEFAALCYTDTKKNKYAYQLEGVDADWVYCDMRRYATYTNLGPGKYIFKVKGSNNDGVWNEKGVSVIVFIHPPWWRSWWAYTGYCLCLIWGLYLINRILRKKIINREHELSRQKELAQAKEIEKAYIQLKQTQNQLVQKEKLASLGELTAGIAHEIQNPLNFVNNFSELSVDLVKDVNEEINKDTFDKEYIKDLMSDLTANQEKINHHGKRASSIVKGMLEHSRASSGERTPTDINQLADEYLRLSYHGLRAKDKNFVADYKTDFDETIPKLNVVSQDIGRVILNLINNAFYAVNEKNKTSSDINYAPLVTVSTKKIGDKIEITVKDNGNGIPDKIKDKIFQPFFTTKPTGEGTGLGLSLAYDIITKGHGGELKVESKEGKGSEFVVILPK